MRRRDFVKAVSTVPVVGVPIVRSVAHRIPTADRDWIDDLFLSTSDPDNYVAVSTRNGVWGDPLVWKLDHRYGEGGCMEVRHEIRVLEHSPDVIGVVFWSASEMPQIQVDVPPTRIFKIEHCIFFTGLSIENPHDPSYAQVWKHTGVPSRPWTHGYVRPHRDGVPKGVMNCL